MNFATGGFLPHSPSMFDNCSGPGSFDVKITEAVLPSLAFLPQMLSRKKISATTSSPPSSSPGYQLTPMCCTRSEMDSSHQRGPRRGTSGLGTKGPRSLTNMAAHVLAYNISSVDDVHLDCVPEKYLRQTWARLQKTGVSLHAWKLLSKYLLRDGEPKTMDLFHHTEHVCQPSLPLSSYISQLTSPTFDFISSLTITGPCHFTTSEMLALSDMPNLGVLEIIAPSAPPNSCDAAPPFPQISNSLFISWSSQSNPFPSLRVLRVWGPGLLTQSVLGHLDKFPSLALFDVLGYRTDWAQAKLQAENLGWECGSPMSRYWDPLLRYLRLVLPSDLITQPESPGSLQFRSKADFVDSELRKYVDQRHNQIIRAPARPRRLLTEVLESRRGRRHGILNHSRATQQPPKGTGPCFGPTSTDLWNFWTCCFVGQLCRDHDIREAFRRHGTKRQPRTLEKDDVHYKSLFEEMDETHTMFENIMLPALPFAHLRLGHYARTREGIHPIWVGEEDSARYTFARRNIHLARKATEGSGTTSTTARHAEAMPYGLDNQHRRDKRAASRSEGGGMRQCKKIKIQDILNSMA